MWWVECVGSNVEGRMLRVGYCGLNVVGRMFWVGCGESDVVNGCIGRFNLNVGLITNCRTMSSDALLQIHDHGAVL